LSSVTANTLLTIRNYVSRYKNLMSSVTVHYLHSFYGFMALLLTNDAITLFCDAIASYVDFMGFLARGGVLVHVISHLI
jgi:hypothetical protein